MSKQATINLLSLRLGEIVARQVADRPDEAFPRALETMRRWGWLNERPEELSRLQKEWIDIIMRKDRSRVLAILTAPLHDEPSVLLRSCAPFAGFVSPRERWKIWREILSETTSA